MFLQSGKGIFLFLIGGAGLAISFVIVLAD